MSLFLPPILRPSYRLIIGVFLFQVGIAYAQLPDSLLQQLAAAETEEARYQLQLEVGKSYAQVLDYEMADSLYDDAMNWAKKTGHDKIRVEALYGKGWYHYQKQAIEQGESYYQAAFALAEEKERPDLHISALSAYSGSLMRYRKPQEALAALEKAVSLMPLAELEGEQAAALFYNLAGAYMMTGRIGEAKDYLKKYNGFMKENQQWQEYATGLNGMGVICKNMGQLDSAKIYYKQSLSAFRSHGFEEPAILFTTVHNLATLAIQSGELDSSIVLQTQALDLAVAAGNPIWQADIYRELGDIYLRTGDTEQSHAFFHKSIALLVPLNAPRELGKTLSFYTKLLQEQGYFKRALDTLEKSNELFGFSEANPIPYCSYLVQKGDLLHEIGQDEQAISAGYTGLRIARNNDFPLWQVNFLTSLGEYYLANGSADSAKYYAKEAIRVGDLNGYQLDKMSAYEIIQDALAELGEYEEALAYSKTYQTLKDSIFKADLSDQVSKERVRQNIISAQEKQAQAEDNAALLASRSRLLTGLLISLGVIFLGGIFFFQQLRRNKVKIEAQNETLAQLNQTKDKFFGIVSHDLRSPLVAFQGLGKQIKHYVQKANLDKLGQIANQVDESSDRLNSLLDNLLNWALLQTGTIPYRPTSISFEEVLLDTFEVFEHNAQVKQIELISEVDPEIKVYADAHALHAILRNLISNALKFTPAGGTITVSTASKEGKSFISVNDTGTGISVENLEKIFSLEKESKTGTAGEKGTGLGLILTKELIELNRGKMEILSELGKGSTVNFFLPATP